MSEKKKRDGRKERGGRKTINRSISLDPALEKAVEARAARLAASGNKPPRYGFSQFTVEALRAYLQSLAVK